MNIPYFCAFHPVTRRFLCVAGEVDGALAGVSRALRPVVRVAKFETRGEFYPNFVANRMPEGVEIVA